MARKTTRYNRWRKAVPVLALSLAAWMPVKQAQAAWPVQEVGIVGQTTILSWAKEFVEWEQQLQSWKTQISGVLNLTNALNMNGLFGLSKIDGTAQTNLINQSCPGPNLLSASGVTQAISSFISSDLTSDIPGNQQKICSQIVTLQIDKYNRTVDMLNRINSFGDKIKQLQGTLNTISSLGGLLGGGQSIADITNKMNQAQQNSTGLDAEMKAYQASIAVDDAGISSLQQMQSNLAKIAIKGKSQGLLGDIAGTLVQAAALKTALAIN